MTSAFKIVRFGQFADGVLSEDLAEEAAEEAFSVADLDSDGNLHLMSFENGIAVRSSTSYLREHGCRRE